MKPPTLTPEDTQTIQQNYRENLDTIYRQVYLALVVIVAMMAYAAAIRYFNYFQNQQAGLLVSLIVALVFSIPLYRRFLRLSTWVLLIGCEVGFAVEVISSPLGHAKYWFALVIAMAGLTLSTRALFSTGIASTLFLLTMFYRFNPDQESYLHAAVLSVLLTLVLYIGNRLLLASFQQATLYVHLADNAMREARSDRGKLVQTVKALDEGNYRLQKAYQKIALARDEANQALEMKIHFANMISHELRAPLNFIIGVTDLMVKSPELYGKESWTPELHEDLRRLYETSQHLSHLVNDVLTLGQIEANRMTMHFELSSIVDVIEDVLMIIRPSYEHRGLYLNLEIGPGISMLQLDRVRIRQVMLNLLNNAYRFVRSGGVSISILREGSEVNVSVEDTGVGIPPDQINNLFQDFFQAQDSDSSGEGTSGLGLSIAQQFIKLHGGHIWVESPVNPGDSLNPGTRFSFCLPLHITGPVSINEDVEHRFWKLQNEGARKNCPLIVFTELAVDDLLTTSSLMNYKMTLVSDRDRIDNQILSLQPNALIEITAGQESLLSDRTRHLLEQESIPYLHCQVHQEDTGVDPQWDAYLVKPFSMEQVREIVEEISPGASRYMVVDDDGNMLRFFQLGLNAHPSSSVQLVQASSGQEARALLEKEIPDVLFLDINLADANGLELLNEIRQEGRYRALPVVIISAGNKPYLYQTQVQRIEYLPGQALDSETFLYEIEGFLDSIRLNTRG